jgi:catechol 2,3-dioxygenase-like lactoylglutathione lyase family enzyme
MTPGAFVALDHLIVAVRDLEAASATYESLLGRAPSWHGSHPSHGSANTLFRLDNTYLELLAPIGEGGLAGLLRARLDAAGDGLVGFALRTEDASACSAALRARGLAASDAVDGEGHETRTAAVRRWRNVLLPREASRGVLVFGIEHRSPPDALPLVEPAEPAAAITGIDHVVVRSEAPEAVIRFYGEQLGLRLALDKTFEQWGARLLFFRVGGVTVEIAAPAKPKADPTRRPVEPASAEDECWGISWRVPDLEAARARLLAAGFDVSETRTGRRPDTRVCTVRAPTCGVATLLIEKGTGEKGDGPPR